MQPDDENEQRDNSCRECGSGHDGRDIAGRTPPCMLVMAAPKPSSARPFSADRRAATVDRTKRACAALTPGARRTAAESHHELMFRIEDIGHDERLQPDRYPHVNLCVSHVGPVEPFGCNSHDLTRDAVHRDQPSEYGAIAVISLLPETVPYDGDRPRGCARRQVLRRRNARPIASGVPRVRQ